MTQSYSKLLDRLLHVNMHSGMKLGLQNSERLNELLDDPIGKFPSVHVAGSNGKGSVCTKIAKAYELRGSRAGLYMSPHIATWRERIKINGVMISEEDAARLLTQIFDLVDKNDIPATYFEITTLLAFVYFAEQKVDMAVIETGLGGRLDATNILTPRLSIITSISLDHTEILGNTLDAIAKEKAGIIKPNVPVVIGPRVPHIVDVIAEERHSPIYRVDGEFEDYLSENNAVAAVAMSVLNIPTSTATKALLALPPCRLEFLPDRQVIMDVAHNPDGLQKLFAAIQNRYPGRRIRCITGLSKDKDIDTCLRVIDAHVNHIHLVQATNGRGTPCLTLEQILWSLGRNTTTVKAEPSIKAAVEHALAKAAAHDELVVICGSFFIMHEAREALGISEPNDS